MNHFESVQTLAACRLDHLDWEVRMRPSEWVGKAVKETVKAAYELVSPRRKSLQILAKSKGGYELSVLAFQRDIPLLVKESLIYLPAGIDYPSSRDFEKHLDENLRQNNQKARQRYARYITNCFCDDGRMSLDLARALKVFGDSRTGREILCFEMLQAGPLLHEIASLWLAEQPTDGIGSPRSDLLANLDARLGGRDSVEVAKAAANTFQKFGKIISPTLEGAFSC